ncbi:MAG TPA: universal stress protein [Nocardioidaceae bacterium]|nr:universal stress protein [Nocardioidaceae bacterium]
MDARERVIVCGIDGSPASQRALEWAVGEARYRGCRLRVVTAWTWDGVEGMMAPTTPADARSQAEIVQRRALLAALDGVEKPPEVERRLVNGRPSEALCTAGVDADMLVLGSRGHTTVHDVFVGSTSQRVIRHAGCPVVLLPDPRHVEHEMRRSRRRRVTMTEPPAATPMF